MEQLMKEVLDELREIRRAISEPPKLLLTKKEVAHLLDVSISTVDRLTKDGVLKAHKLGECVRYKRNEILEAV